MSYTITSTERTKEKCSEEETKALFYLLSCRKDSPKVFFFVVDFFNDLTGIDKLITETWDLQSKNDKRNSANDIGRNLVTLFKNYASDLEFTHFILFMKNVDDKIRIDESKNEFSYSDVTDSAAGSILSGLKAAISEKEYTKDLETSDEELQDFLGKVTFVVFSKERWECVRDCISVNPEINIKNEKLNGIFREIMDKQSALKNTCSEGIVLHSLGEFSNYRKYLTSGEIKALILSRIITGNALGKNYIPEPFSSIYSAVSAEEKTTFFEGCQNGFFAMLNDPNITNEYWALFSHLLGLIMTNPTDTVDILYKKADKDMIRNVHYLDYNSARYFIAIVKEGIEQ